MVDKNIYKVVAEVATELKESAEKVQTQAALMCNEIASKDKWTMWMETFVHDIPNQLTQVARCQHALEILMDLINHSDIRVQYVIKVAAGECID